MEWSGHSPNELEWGVSELVASFLYCFVDAFTACHDEAEPSSYCIRPKVKADAIASEEFREILVHHPWIIVFVVEVEVE